MYLSTVLKNTYSVTVHLWLKEVCVLTPNVFFDVVAVNKEAAGWEKMYCK